MEYLLYCKTIRFYTFMALNLCQADFKVQHQNPIKKIIYP